MIHNMKDSMKIQIYSTLGLILILGLVSCNMDLNKLPKDNSQKIVENIYKDEVLQTIYTLQDERNSTKLMKYLNNEYPEYRKAAVLAFASIQDSMAIMPIAALFADEDENIRISVAYTLGQIKHASAENILLSAFQSEKSNEVKKNILEALGKCGTEVGLNFVASFSFRKDEILLLTGQAWALTRFAQQGLISKQSTAKAIELLSTPNISEKIRFIISFYFVRAKELDLSSYQNELISAYKTDGYVYTRMNLAAAMGKAKTMNVLDFLKSILKSNTDYRIKVNVIEAFRKFEYSDVANVVFSLLKDANVNVGIKASEFFVEKGEQTDAKKYFDLARKLNNWRLRTNLLAASLKYSELSAKADISNSITSGYEVAENIYEKASLLKALSGDIQNYKFIESQIFSSKEYVIKSYGMEALVEIRRNSDFDAIAKTLSAKGENLFDDFALIFKRAIQSADVAMISITAEILRDKQFKYNEVYKNTYFLTQALNQCQLPQDIEAYLELQKTISYINGSELAILPQKNQLSIDWKLVVSISPIQKMLIKTTKGEITIQLLVNESPGSVASFVKLAKEGFYNGKMFHRVVPNFVAQDGCPRGDGWGSPDFTIRSEFYPRYYNEGAVGMASAGKDTESSQWFITHNPTSHLDGRYTIFANVVEGMEVVHKLEIGDKIISIEPQ